MIVIGTNGNAGGDNDTVIGVDGNDGGDDDTIIGIDGGDNDTVIGVDGNGGGDDDSVIGVNGKVSAVGSSPSGGGHSSNSALGTYTWVWGLRSAGQCKLCISKEPFIHNSLFPVIFLLL